MLLTMYSAGLRRSELCRLKVSNIDSGRMMIRIERGKGDVDREVPLSQKLLTTLREFFPAESDTLSIEGDQAVIADSHTVCVPA